MPRLHRTMLRIRLNGHVYLIAALSIWLQADFVSGASSTVTGCYFAAARKWNRLTSGVPTKMGLGWSRWASVSRRHP